MVKPEELFNVSHLTDIREEIMKRKETISVAESVTSGLIQAAFSNVPDASSFFQGGITAYNLAQKYKHLRIEPIHAMEYNCVSERVASDMAVNVCDAFNSQWGLGITGYAVPVPESGNKLFAYCSIAYKKKLLSIHEIAPPKNTEALHAQLFYVNQLLQQLYTHLKQAG